VDYDTVFVDTEQDEEGSFTAVMSQIATEIACVDLSIVRGISEHDGRPYWVLINCSTDEFAQLGTDYSSSDIAVLKKLVCPANYQH
jgi:hypothetical protein